ncbi:hypothetical protein [Paenibacillus aestuarii]|uniref:50S ribosomal protein L29 n=1 Tax=Paenibacillus aestuarii TaxID=516965 RepID=A0ABW0KJ91_9BACL|nr:hypothetical protein [Paenibacillus aestuarii]
MSIDNMSVDELKDEVVKLREENLMLKQEIAKLRSAKRPASKATQAMETMSTKLKEALRE